MPSLSRTPAKKKIDFFILSLDETLNYYKARRRIGYEITPFSRPSLHILSVISTYRMETPGTLKTHGAREQQFVFHITVTLFFGGGGGAGGAGGEGYLELLKVKCHARHSKRSPAETT